MVDKVLVSLSGGLDSTAALALALAGARNHPGREVEAVCFRYPSKHNGWECLAAQLVASHYHVGLRDVWIYGLFGGFRSSLLLGSLPLPEGHYEDESMRSTVVPGRNIIFLSALAGLAMSGGFSQVWFGCHAGDHRIYPDCRPGFLTAMKTAVDAASEGKVELVTPWVGCTKADVIRICLSLESPIPWHLTRTCYSAEGLACGRCGACQERLEAFHLNGLEDPLPYHSRELIPRSEEKP
jgi:7-cyano-7-deazaguanine synthase